jgi:PAS domain S-box-containing protein
LKTGPSEARFRTLVEQGYDTITLIGADGTVQYTSPAMERLTGYTPAERRQQSIEDLVHVDDREPLRERWRQLCRVPGGSSHVEMRVRHKDGSWRIVESIATNYLADPDIHCIVVNTRDVRERRAAEAALQAAERRVLTAQVEAIQLTARALADRLNNDLVGIAGVLRLVELYAALPEDLGALLPEAVASLDRACEAVTHLADVTHVATHDTPLGPALDLERSAAPDAPP